MRNILLLFILSLIAIPCYGANNTWDVQASGGDYDSLHLAIANDTTISAGDTLFIVTHIAQDTTTSTSAVTWDNWTINGTVIVKPADSIRHDGILSTSKAIWRLRNWLTINNAGDIIFEGMQFRCAASSILDDGATASTPTFKECIFAGNGASAINTNFGASTGEWKIINCLFINFSGSGITFQGTTATTILLYNCTFFNVSRSVTVQGAVAQTLKAINCLSINSTATPTRHWYRPNTSATLSLNYCASDDSTTDNWGGTGNLTEKDFIMCDTANDNLKLSPLDTICIGTGLDLYDSVTTIDGMNHPRSDNYDIGFSQAPVGGYYQADASDLIFFQIQSGLGANRFYGNSNTAVIGLEAGLGAFNSNIIFYVLNITDTVANYVRGDVNQTLKIDSVVCSLYVTGMSFAAGGDTMMGVNILDTLVDIGEAGTGGTSVECGTSWNQEEEAGGGGTCTDVNWGSGGGDYLSAATYNDSMLFSGGLTTPTWIRNSFSSSSEITDYFNDLVDTTLAWQDETERKAGVQSAVGALIVHYNPNSFDCNWTVSTEDGTNIPKFQFWGASLGGWVEHSISDTETPDFGLHGDNRHGGSRH